MFGAAHTATATPEVVTTTTAHPEAATAPEPSACSDTTKEADYESPVLSIDLVMTTKVILELCLL